MNKIMKCVAVLVTAFFMTPAYATEESTEVCAEETQETNLTDAIEESPELLMATAEGQDLEVIFQRMEYLKVLVGEVPADKLYVFRSERHPTWVYIFFLKDHCITDVQFTYKNLVEYLLTGDEDLIRSEGSK